jgi:hypothetical protein
LDTTEVVLNTDFQESFKKLQKHWEQRNFAEEDYLTDDVG